MGVTQARPSAATTKSRIGRRTTSTPSPAPPSTTPPRNARRSCRSTLRAAQLLVFRPDPGFAADRARLDDAVLGGLRQALSEHQGRRRSEPQLQRDARQAAHRRARQGGADGGAPAHPVGRRVRGQGPAARVRPGGRRLQDRGRVLAGRDEVGDLEGQDLRRADQQRDDGADLERGDLPRRRASTRSQPPATWDDVVAYSRQIKEKTGKNGYGMVARVNAGNTPFRFMPQLWAYGGGALDEAEANPTYKTITSTTRARGRRCRRPTTCTCATSRCRPRPSPTRRPRTRTRSSPASSR